MEENNSSLATVKISPKQILLTCGKAFGKFFTSFLGYFILGCFLNTVVLLLWYLWNITTLGAVGHILFWILAPLLSIGFHFIIAFKNSVIGAYKVLYRNLLRTWLVAPLSQKVVASFWKKKHPELQGQEQIEVGFQIPKEELTTENDEVDEQATLWVHDRMVQLSPFWRRALGFFLWFTPVGGLISEFEVLDMTSKANMQEIVDRKLDEFFENLAENAMPIIIQYIGWIHYVILLLFLMFA